jgi:uncharacterized protein YbjT (DUF2867 family)
MRTAIIGATGLVGSLLAERMLLRPVGEVHALLRRPSGRHHPNWHEHVAPPADWPGLVRNIRPDAAMSALGTTMRAAGSQAAFRAVDYDMVVAFAGAARAAGATRMAVISSVGADPGSRNFYLRLKGEMEQALRALAFDRLAIFRPGLLRGERGGERRLGERIGIAVSPIVNLVMRGPLDRFAAIDAEIVAAAIEAWLRSGESGVYENRAIRQLARDQRRGVSF